MNSGHCKGKCGGCRKSEDEKDVCDERSCHEDALCDENKNCDDSIVKEVV